MSAVEREPCPPADGDREDDGAASDASGSAPKPTPTRATDTRKRVLRALLLGVPTVLVAFGLMQLVPYRISNPPVRQEPNWDSPQTRQLAVAACFDCHSNEVKKPWYARVAPISWWLTNHVNDGRDALNFSDWANHHGETGDLTEAVKNGSMPPSYFTWFGLHPEAKLTQAQRDALAEGLRKTAAQSGGTNSGTNGTTAGG